MNVKKKISAARKDDVFRQRTRRLQLFQRRRADKDERHLHQFRRLKRERAERDPVQRAVRRLGEQKVERQQSHRRKGERHAQKHRALRAAQQKRQDRKARDAQPDRDELLNGVALVDARADRQPDPRQEERQDLQREVAALRDQPRQKKIEPLRNDVNGKDQPQRFVEYAVGKCRRDERKKLEQRHKQQHPSPPERFLLRLFFDRLLHLCRAVDRSVRSCHSYTFPRIIY